MKFVASCSNGKDSLAMVLGLIERNAPLDHVIYIDTQKEFNSIYRNWEKLTKILDEHNIKHTRLSFDFDYLFSEKEVNARNGETKHGYSWCGGRCRWGTTQKSKLIKDFYKSNYGDELICEYVGIACDELKRVKIERSDTVKIYPLILWGMTENDALVKCYKAGFSWQEDNGIDLYDVLDRVSCFCCGNKNLKELKAIHDYLPSYWQKLCEMQDRTSIPFRDGKKVNEIF